MVEQLVDVSVPESVILARGRDAHHMVLLMGEGYTSRPVDPAGIHRQPRAVKKLLGKAEVVAVVDVLVNMQLKAPAVLADRQWKVPQIPFIDSVLDFLSLPQRRVRTVQTVQQIGDSTAQFFVGCCHARCCATTGAGGSACEHAGQVPAVFSSWRCPDEVRGREFALF